MSVVRLGTAGEGEPDKPARPDGAFFPFPDSLKGTVLSGRQGHLGPQSTSGPVRERHVTTMSAGRRSRDG